MQRKLNRRVLHIMSSYGGGISTFIHNIASEIYKFGIVFDVVTYDPCPQNFIDTIKRTGGDVYQLKNPKKAGWRQFRQSLGRVLELYTYNTIHCHISGYRAIAYKMLANSYSNADFIIHAHYYVDDSALTIPTRLMHYINQQINQTLSTHYVGCSRQAVESLFGYNIDKNNIIIIPNSIDASQFMYDELTYAHLRNKGRRDYNIEADDLVIGQIGRLDPIKNHQLTLQIAQMAQNQTKKIHVLMAGSGKLENELRLHIKNKRLEDTVQLLGRVSPISALFPVLDAVIFPSFNEGLGTTAIESQAAGVPVVMSNTIPPEVELNLELTYRLSVAEEPANWLNTLIKATKANRPTNEERLLALERNNYTNYQAARLYATLVSGARITNR